MSDERGKAIPSHTLPDALCGLWEIGFFVSEKNLNQVVEELSASGCNPAPNSLRMALVRAKFLTKRGPKGDRRFIQKTAASRVALSKELFPEDLIGALSCDFAQELSDLRLNYGRSGTCTAFLLRKILEKLIFKTFAKKGMGSKLKDDRGEFFGLSPMLKLAAGSTVDGVPFLMPKTAKEIEGIKFLGDTAAHNPIVNVDMKTIEPVMPFIVTAYLELAKKL